ncbi:MAG: glycerophosphodiester phosphodiesterase [Clostridia bacterium]|nr:glycerophosphodiester phosphodiesterase [Clostridia bacterium]
MITAHGGALGTIRNSKLYFARADSYLCDTLEVDVRRKGGRLYLNHTPRFITLMGTLSLAYAFDVVKDKDMLINCDLKSRGIAQAVESLALEMGVADKLIFTGSITEKEASELTCGMAFFNSLDGISYSAGNAGEIKRRLDSYNSKVFAGINVNKWLVTDEFIRECVAEGIKVSLFTINSRREALKYATMGLYNITTNIPDTVYSIVGNISSGKATMNF